MKPWEDDFQGFIFVDNKLRICKDD